jgi:arylformamidase
MRLVDLSHDIEHEMVTYPGLPGPQISEHLSFEASTDVYAPGTEFVIGHISMVANTGTYLDTPAHRYRDGDDLSGSGIGGVAVLLRTGWDRHWGTDRYADPAHPYLTEDGAQELVDQGAVLVGIDSVNIDGTTTGERPAHSLLLAAGIPIVEHLTHLHELPPTGARFTAVPPRVRGLATFPVRAFASIP